MSLLISQPCTCGNSQCMPQLMIEPGARLQTELSGIQTQLKQEQADGRELYSQLDELRHYQAQLSAMMSHEVSQKGRQLRPGRSLHPCTCCYVLC